MSNQYPEYKEDSTKGKAMVIPKTYKGDVLTQVWLDSRMLATLDTWLNSYGMSTRFMSDVVRECLNSMMDRIIESDVVEVIDDTLRARDYLQFKFKVNLNPSDRGKRNVNHNKVLSGLRPRLSNYHQDIIPRSLSPSEQLDDSELADASQDRYTIHPDRGKEIIAQAEANKLAEREAKTKAFEDKVFGDREFDEPEKNECVIKEEHLDTQANNKMSDKAKNDIDDAAKSNINEVTALLKSIKCDNAKKGSDLARPVSREEEQAHSEEVARKEEAYQKELKKPVTHDESKFAKL